MFSLPSIHDTKTEGVPKRGLVELVSSKLKLLNDHNSMYMRRVDCNDALIGNYTSICKSFEWTIKTVFRFIEEAISSSSILFDKIKSRKLHFMNFTMDIIETIITRANNKNQPTTFPHLRIDKHFLELIPPTVKKRNPQKRCV